MWQIGALEILFIIIFIIYERTIMMVKQKVFNKNIKNIVFENIFILFALLTCKLSHSKLYILQIILMDIM